MVVTMELYLWFACYFEEALPVPAFLLKKDADWGGIMSPMKCEILVIGIKISHFMVAFQRGTATAIAEEAC